MHVTDRLGDLSRQPSVYKLDSRQVAETAGSLDNLLLVLPMLPGAVATDDQEGKLAVRGGGPEHNVVMFDGVQIHSPQRVGDFSSSFVNPAVGRASRSTRRASTRARRTALVGHRARYARRRRRSTPGGVGIGRPDER